MNREEKRSGFTLIETMVSVIIFTVVMSMALAIFLATVRDQRFSVQRQRLINETSYALNRTEEKLRGKNDFEGIDTSWVNQEINNILSDRAEISYSDVEVTSGNKRITIILETRTNVEEGDDSTVKFQTTIFSRN